MNIISNDCVAGYIYTKCLKTNFKNPFAWCSINLTNFCNLIKLYNDLDFRNTKINLIKNDSPICTYGSIVPNIIIDNIININFFHYIQSNRYNATKKVGGYKFSNNILEYTKNEYYKRLERMTEQPIFIWHITKNIWYNDKGANPIDEFKSISSKFKIIIFGEDLKTEVIDNMIILNDEQRRAEIHISGENIYKKIKDLI